MDNEATTTSSKRNLYVIVGVLFLVSIFYRMVQSSDFNNSSVLFIGIPALLTILMIKYGGEHTTTLGLIFKVITLFLLMSAIVLGEGTLCVVIAAPIFYTVGCIIAIIYDYLNKKTKDNINAFILLPLAIILSQPLGINRISPESVASSVKYDYDVSIVDLAASPDFQHQLPVLFRSGFPQPISISGVGMHVGDQRRIEFLSNTKGLGALVLEIDKIEDTSIHFNMVSDNTHIGSWLSWQRVRVDIEQFDGGSIVTWTSDYTCDLGPQWYFAPIERHAVGLMNEHLIRSYFDR